MMILATIFSTKNRIQAITESNERICDKISGYRLVS